MRKLLMGEPLTPEQLDAQEYARRKLRELRHEYEAFQDWYPRRDATIVASDETGLSLRDIASEIGMSPQGVLNILNKYKKDQEGDS